MLKPLLVTFSVVTSVTLTIWPRLIGLGDAAEAS